MASSAENPGQLGGLAAQSSPVLRFPAGFLWGVSTAAYQVEGNSPDCQWAQWEAAGKIRSGHQSGLACNWWKNAEQDFDIAAKLGINALRLSLEWSRLEPRPGEWDSTALDRYRQMLQALLDRQIKPMVCLHHFTHPAWFEARGGFLAPDAPRVFERFVARVATELSDLCSDWVTFNEPNVYAAFGYVIGDFPPGGKGRILAALRAMKNMVHAHTGAYHKIHELQANAQVGWAQHYAVFEPANPASRLDVVSANNIHRMFNESFLGTIETGRLRFPFNVLDGHLSEARGACDFVGLNVYSRFHVAFNLRLASQLFADVFVPAHVPQGDSGVEKPYGEAYPEAIRYAVERAASFGKPIYILENGVPDASDQIRPWLIVNAAKQVQQLITEGHDIRGYFHWTLTDNFEWSEGWRLRFGLVELDPETQQRRLRNSARLYGAIAQANAISEDMLRHYAQRSV
jgi:beta-glucosidase